MADPEKPGTYHVHTHSSGAEYWRSVIEIVAFIVAAGWAFYVFIYQEQIKPAVTPPHAEVTFSLSHQFVQSGREFVTVSFEVHNVGSVRLKPAGYVVNAYGYRYLPRVTQTLTMSLNRNVTRFNRTLGESRPVLLQSVYARFPNFGAANSPYFLSPGTTSRQNFAFGVPRGAYDVIFLRYKYCVAWYGNTKVYDPQMYRDSGGAFWFRFKTLDPNLPIACGQATREEFPL